MLDQSFVAMISLRVQQENFVFTLSLLSDKSLIKRDSFL